ncbi:glycerophosphodiester phosphodiesterase family protein [Winogradskyella vidalii]|uniref:glycerophosphodiester phosphodiesterase family protein n=1 Tax=Winogradskyella vidalii TaxID=2615024 RepID=UPI0015CC0147|nr:glycerophosphodiester phosphodiesterase family protein [Winogradskyella vidalii]
MKHFLYIFIAFAFLACKESKEATPVLEATPTLDVQPSKLIETFKASKSNYPAVSVHRGGVDILNYPENCLETIQYVSNRITAIYEIDVAQTKDEKLVLLHDNSIDRTTTGSGKVTQYTFDELKQFNLIDDFGNETSYKIPLFSEVLTWAKKHNVILTIDIKRSVGQQKVIEAIKSAKAEDIAVIITYDLEEAKSAYQLAPEFLLSVSARNNDEFERLLKSEIPTKNMLAFTGTRLSDASLFEKLHANDIVCILGTLGNLDKRAKARGEELYLQWKENGADILATDRPFEVFEAIN